MLQGLRLLPLRGESRPVRQPGDPSRTPLTPDKKRPPAVVTSVGGSSPGVRSDPVGAPSESQCAGSKRER